MATSRNTTARMSRKVKRKRSMLQAPGHRAFLRDTLSDGTRLLRFRM